MCVCVFVTDFVNKVLKDAGYDEKTAKKREKGQPSIYSTCSIERVQAIYKNEDGLKEKLRGVLRETMWQQYTNNIKGKFGTSEFEKKDNPRSGITEPHFEELLKSYNAPRFLSKQNAKQEEEKTKEENESDTVELQMLAAVAENPKKQHAAIFENKFNLEQQLKSKINDPKSYGKYPRPKWSKENERDPKLGPLIERYKLIYDPLELQQQ